MAILKSPPLEERIEKLRAEIDAFIDERVVEEAKTCPGVPLVVVRRLIENRAPGNPFQQYLILKKVDDENAAQGNAA